MFPHLTFTNLLVISSWMANNEQPMAYFTKFLFYKTPTHTIHATIVYLPTWMVDFYGFHVGKYTVRPMDPMGHTLCLACHMDQKEIQGAT